MVMLKNPDMPATSKQLWLLHILTKTDTRNLNLTMQQASERINELKSSVKPICNKPTIKPTTKQETTIEREVIQGKQPDSITDMVKIQTDFELNAKPLAIAKLQKENCYTSDVKIDFYNFNCKECLFGQSGICEPKWDTAGHMTCGNKVESVSFKCKNFEPTIHSQSEYCYRPKGKQCHRKSIENHCLNCNFRSNKFRMDYSNHTAWFTRIPTIKERLEYYTKQLENWHNPPTSYSDIDYSSAIKNTENIIRLLNKLGSE
jgi:hypothetical protein